MYMLYDRYNQVLQDIAPNCYNSMLYVTDMEEEYESNSSNWELI